jgi:hypothetical protein
VCGLGEHGAWVVPGQLHGPDCGHQPGVAGLVDQPPEDVGSEQSSEGVGGGCGDRDGVGVVDDDEFGPVEGTNGGVAVDAFEVDFARAAYVVGGEDVADVVAVDGADSPADGDVEAGGDGGIELGSLFGGIGDTTVAFGVGGVPCPALQFGGGEAGDQVGDDRRVGVVDDDEVLCCAVLESVEEVGFGVGLVFGGEGMPWRWASVRSAAWWLVAYSQASWRARDKAT